MKLSFFNVNKEEKKPSTSTSTLPSKTAQDWQRDKEIFLTAVNQAVTTGHTEDLASSWERLCQLYGTQRTVAEWEFLFRTLQAHCQPLFAPSVAMSAATPASIAERRQALTHAIQQALPPVLPMEWRLIACVNAVEADTFQPTAFSPSAAFLYWPSGEHLLGRYWPPSQSNLKNQKSIDINISELLQTAKLSAHPDIVVENILALLTLQGVFKNHPLLTIDILRVALTHVNQKKQALCLSVSEKQGGREEKEQKEQKKPKDSKDRPVILQHFCKLYEQRAC